MSEGSGTYVGIALKTNSDMNTIRETFKKSERLCSTKIISGLFETGSVYYTPLFKIVWGFSPVLLEYPAQVAFSVSKRGFRLAVTRNLIKRRLREAYRKNKGLLYDNLINEKKQIVFIVILRGSSIPVYERTEKSIIEMMLRLNTQINEASQKC